MKRIVLLTLVLALSACAAGPPDTPTPTPAPLTPTHADVRAEIPVEDIGGELRRPGLLTALVEADFNTGRLREGRIELVEDTASTLGYRRLTLRVADVTMLSALELVRALPGVVAAEPWRVRTPQTNDAYWSYQTLYGIDLLNLTPAWMLLGTGSSAVRVGTVDSGVTVVPELVGKITGGTNVMSGEDLSDPHGHGTMVASIIAAQENNQTGIAGVASGTRVVPVKACYPQDGVTFCDQGDVYDAYEWLYDQAYAGAIDVVNLSLGLPAWDSQEEIYLDALDQLGVIIVAAAGNAGTGTVYYPARSSHVVAVGGATSSGYRHAESSYGAELDVLAPHTTYAITNTGAAVAFPGTSGAAAIISGLAALFKSTQPVGGAWGVGLSNRARFMVLAAAYGDAWTAERGSGVPDAYMTLWPGACSRFDVQADQIIDIFDAQRFAYRFGTFTGNALYRTVYDIQPPLMADGDIDMLDLQSTFGRLGMTCP